MADGTIISGLTKMKEEPLSAFDAFDAYCQNGENDNSPPSEHQIENSGHEEMSGQEFDSHKEHEQRAKRRRVSNDVDLEQPGVKDEEQEMGMEDEMKEFAIKNEEFDVEALYNQGTVDDPPALPPTPEKKGKKKDKNKVVSAKIEFTPLENAPKVARQAGSTLR